MPAQRDYLSRWKLFTTVTINRVTVQIAADFSEGKVNGKAREGALGAQDEKAELTTVSEHFLTQPSGKSGVS